MTADRDDLAAILAKHAGWKPSGKGLLIIECDPCGHLMGIGPEPIDPNQAHRAHVAQMVLESDWLRDVKADVWDVGFNDGAHYASADMSHATYRTPPPPNPHRLERTAACRYDRAEDYCDSCDPPYGSCPYRADRSHPRQHDRPDVDT